MFLLKRSFLIVVLLLGACSAEVEHTPVMDKPDAADIALNNRGVALMGYFDYGAARGAFRQVVDRKPHWLDAKVNLAIATLNRQLDGDEELARSYLREVLALDADHLRARFVLGLLLERAGESEQAIEHYTFVHEHDPRDAYAAYYLAVLIQSSDPQRALGLFRHALSIDPYLRSAYYGAFLLMVRSGDRDGGLVMKEAYERMADNPRAKLAETKYTRMGDKANALAVGVAPVIREPRPEGDLFGAVQVITTFAGQHQRSLTTVDIQGDGLQDIVVADRLNPSQLIIAAEDEYQVSTLFLADVAAPVRAFAWGDLDNNGSADAVVCRADTGGVGIWSRNGNQYVENPAGLKALVNRRNCTDLMLLDADHDGDLDIFVIFTAGGHDIFSNNGDNTYRSLASESAVPFAPLQGLGLLAADLDADRDADLIVINADGKNDVLFNDRLWNYQKNASAVALEDAALLAVTAADLDANGTLELYSINTQGQLQQWQQNRDDAWSAQNLLQLSASTTAQLATTDFNGDGFVDLLLIDDTGLSIVEMSTGAPSAIFSYTGDVVTAIPVVADADRGPSLFALVNEGDGQNLLHWPPGPGRGRFAALTFTGKEEKADSMRSNRSGIGTAVAIRRGSEWTIETTFDNHSGSGQSLQPLAIGMAGFEKADFIAVDWSDGVFQTELDLAAGRKHAITETQRQLSSCPVLFYWNGTEWSFASDVLGVGGIGFLQQPGLYHQPRPWEHFLFPENALRPVNGELQIKITEPMEEIALIDSATLSAYDLAPGWRMTLDERMGTGGPEVTGEPIFYRHEILPVKATRDDGLDVTAAVMEVDQIAADPGELHERFLGRLAATRSMTLEFERPLSGDRNPVLLAHGWVEYPYSQTVFAAWQASQYYRPPALEAAGADGRWQTVYDSFGYPAGMPRQMSLPLAHLPADTIKLRISGNLQIYWDRLAIIYAEEPGADMTRTEFALRSAVVAQSGFAQRTNGNQHRPVYDYKKRTPFWDSRYPAGHYTRLGEALPLAAKADGAFVIIGPGEEVQLSYTDNATTRSDWTRHFVLYTRGYAKDMDMYTQDSGTVGPLPAIPDANVDLHRHYNTRYQQGY